MAGNRVILEQPGANKLVLVERLQNTGVEARVLCAPGVITILSDEFGKSLTRYEAAVCGFSHPAEMRAELYSQPLSGGSTYQVGVSEVFAGGITSRQFLDHAGLSSVEIEQLLAFHGLRNTSYLPCVDLPQAAQRQLRLIAALRSNTPVLVLRDPFAPIGSRWREFFARLILEDAMRTKRIVVCTRLAIPPLAWNNQRQVQTVDVGILAQQAVRKSRREHNSDAIALTKPAA